LGSLSELWNAAIRKTLSVDEEWMTSARPIDCTTEDIVNAVGACSDDTWRILWALPAAALKSNPAER
jgi:hypothetical protein